MTRQIGVIDIIDVSLWLDGQGYETQSEKLVVIGKFENNPINIFHQKLFLGTLFVIDGQMVFKISEKNTATVVNEAKKVAEKISGQFEVNVSIR